MAGVNIILGISELKWTEIGEFNSGNHYIYYCRQESLRRNKVALTVNKTVTSVSFQGKPLNMTLPQPLMLEKLKLTIKIYKTL